MPKDTESTKGYTTRLTDPQATQVEEAARLAGTSTAKFIRDAALGRARDILNSTGANAKAMSRLSEQMLDAISNPSIRVWVEVRGQRMHIDCSFSELERDDGNFLDGILAYELEEGRYRDSFPDVEYWQLSDAVRTTHIRPVPPEADLLTAMKVVHSTAPTEFAARVVEEIESRASGSKSYSPRVTDATR